MADGKNMDEEKQESGVAGNGRRHAAAGGPPVDLAAGPTMKLLVLLVLLCLYVIYVA